MGAEEEMRGVLEPLVQARGLSIWDVECSGASVRVLVERPGGVDLDALSELSDAISAELDRRDDLVPAGRYVLEVSSPGLERRLREASHFASSVGEEVAVKTAEPFAGSRRLTGTLVSATETDITLRRAPGDGVEAMGGDEELVRIPLSCVVRAHRVFRWPNPEPAVRTGSGRPKAKARPRRPAKARASAGTSVPVDLNGTNSQQAHEATRGGHGRQQEVAGPLPVAPSRAAGAESAGALWRE